MKFSSNAFKFALASIISPVFSQVCPEITYTAQCPDFSTANSGACRYYSLIDMRAKDDEDDDFYFDDARKDDGTCATFCANADLVCVGGYYELPFTNNIDTCTTDPASTDKIECATKTFIEDFYCECKEAEKIKLPTKFELPSPNCTTNATEIGIVTCAFKEFVCPANATQSVRILNYNCDAEYNSTRFGNTNVTGTTTLSTCDPNVSEFDAIANVDYKSGHEGEVNFCIRTDLIESNEIMYYRSQRVNMTFAYDGAFSVASFDTTKYEGISKDATIATKSFGVSAVICDNGGNTLTNPPVLAIGVNLFVCINTKDEGTNIASITNFTAEKDMNTNTPQTLAINESNSNVVVTGLGSEKLMVVINFPARFFSTDDVIVLKGNVDVKITNSRRLSGSRALEETTPKVSSGEGKFGLVIEIVADTSSATGHDMMVAALIGIPALLLV